VTYLIGETLMKWRKCKIRIHLQLQYWTF
jgi:hypothetical protein